MKALFEAIQRTDTNRFNMVLTVLDGENIGEKVLTSDGSILWESQEHGFFRGFQDEIKALDDSGVIRLGGHEVFCDVLGNEKQIVICGGGHVSIPVITLGVMMGCEVTVLEDRPLFADNARRAGATKVICAPFEEGLEQVKGNADTYFVIVTRGHRYDQICLEKIARKEHAYIGMIGSRRRTTLVKQILAEKGIDKNVLDSVYTPIGLDIGAETPVEIAVAIMAEIIEVKNKKKRTCGYTKEIMQAVLNPESGSESKVMATIVKRKGSAPQGVGIKMLVLRSGTCIGTIGGGCMEANIMQKALLMASGNGPEAVICKVDMTGADAEEEGMVCGGVVSVLLERVK
ncbi:XdhC family protein [bacterium]|uniref:XdhC family protein n=1 Tax=Lachnospiraceae TaxID=186803 RepID=UPI002A7EC563|nr:XdhC family protein [Blautia sp.]MCI6092881.1 XdhC family protein [bacterium]MDY4115403.1 XdhC family protein [Blautia sp.]MDY4502967.1 XdhC family protein [Bariatricus sp.]